MSHEPEHGQEHAAASGTLLLGRDHADWGEFTLALTASGLAASAISVGARPGSPALGNKGDEAFPNEDALVCLDHDPQVLLAVADAHFGIEASHSLITQLAAAPALPASFSELQALVASLFIREDDSASATALVVAVHDRASGSGFGISFGDCTLLKLGPGGVHHLNVRTVQYLAAETGATVNPELGVGFQFVLDPGELLVAFTDGINECHYRSPGTSIGGEHLRELFRRTGPRPEAFTAALVELALRGVDGHPGGEDNIAVVASAAGPERHR